MFTHRHRTSGNGPVILASPAQDELHFKNFAVSPGSELHRYGASACVRGLAGVVLP